MVLGNLWSISLKQEIIILIEYSMGDAHHGDVII